MSDSILAAFLILSSLDPIPVGRNFEIYWQLDWAMARKEIVGSFVTACAAEE